MMNDSTAAAPVLVSVIVKALNEEALIDACLRSIIAELEGLPGEIILADSVSTDRTVDIAMRYPVEIVQFCSAADRGCGAALQLGYQFARGRYLYVIDGDMVLLPGFLRHALDYLERHPGAAGVGGLLQDARLNTAADHARAAHYGAIRREHEVASLGGGGLYRRDAIEGVGYLANRWLPACEEAELGARLLAAGWKLVRSPMPAVSHTGHEESTPQMLKRLWRNGRMQAYGMFLRGALGRPWFGHAARTCWFVFVAPLLHLGILAAALIASQFVSNVIAVFPLLEFAAWSSVLLFLTWRKHSAGLAFTSVVAWHMYALAAARGFVRAPADPTQRIAARVLRAL